MNVCPILLLEKEGVFLFYCMYLIKFASKRSSVLEWLQVLFGISGTVCSQVLAIIMVIRVKSI